MRALNEVKTSGSYSRLQVEPVVPPAIPLTQEQQDSIDCVVHFLHQGYIREKS